MQSSLQMIDDQADTVMQSTRQGHPSPTQLWALALELSCLAGTALGAQGQVPSTCFPVSVFDPIIGTV